jgi:hypothetical protein
MKQAKNIVISSDKGTLCHIADCKYTRSCANHISAGDYRTEGGFSPMLTLGKDKSKVVCWSAFSTPRKNYGGCKDEPSNSSEIGYVDYDAVIANPTITLYCEYCNMSDSFHAKYDLVDKTIKLQCSECKYILDVDNNSAIKAEKRKSLSRLVKKLTKGQPPITQEETDAVRKEWEAPNEKTNT